jgi:cell division septum initiation protein DivIVA
VAGSELPPPPDQAPHVPGTGAGITDVRDSLPPELRDPSFSISVRGYDRHAVDRYVERVNRLIAELQVSGSPRAAVRHALDRVGEQTSGILQRARDTAEEIITSAREEAEETTQRAKAEARDILAAGEREASEAASRATAEAEQIIAGARARSDELLRQAADEAEQTVARARADAEAEERDTRTEIAALLERSEARLHALEVDIDRVAEARGALIAEARGLAKRLTQVVAEAEGADAQEPDGA